MRSARCMPVQINSKIDISKALELTDLILKKLPYATNNALTRTAKELVEVERGALKSEFQVRKQFILNRVKITKFSRANDLNTRVAIDSNVQGGKLLLSTFEEGGEKLPELGSELAIPLTGGPARRSFSEKVLPSLLYKSLNMQRHVTAAGKIQYKGDRRTFVIAGVGIFQRIASKTRGSRSKKQFASKGETLRAKATAVLVYSFKKTAPLKARMHFVKTAREFVAKRFSQIWAEEFARELVGRTKRKRT